MKNNCSETVDVVSKQKYVQKLHILRLRAQSLICIKHRPSIPQGPEQPSRRTFKFWRVTDRPIRSVFIVSTSSEVDNVEKRTSFLTANQIHTPLWRLFRIAQRSRSLAQTRRIAASRDEIEPFPLNFLPLFPPFFSAFLFPLLSTLHILSFGLKSFDEIIGKP